MAIALKLKSVMNLDLKSFTAKLKGAGEDMRKFQRNSDKTISRVQRNFKKLRGSVNSLRGAIVAVAAVAGIGKLVGGMEGIIDAARQLNIESQQLASLQHVFGGAGLKLGDTLAIVQKLQEVTGKVLDGSASPEVIAQFKRLNVSAAYFGKLGLEERIGLVAKALEGIENPAQKTSFLIGLLGDQGTKLSRVLGSGVAGFAAELEDANKKGIKIDPKTEFIIKDLTDSFFDLFETVKEGIRQAFIDSGFAELLTKFVRWLQTLVGWFNNLGETMGGTVLKSILSATAAVGIFIPVLQALSGILNVLGVSPFLPYILAATAAIVGITAVVQGLQDLLNGGTGENFISRFVEDIQWLDNIIDGVMDKVVKLIDLGSKVTGFATGGLVGDFPIGNKPKLGAAAKEKVDSGQINTSGNTVSRNADDSAKTLKSIDNNLNKFLSQQMGGPGTIKTPLKQGAF